MKGRSLGHYEIVDIIGSGGMGQIYRARDTKLGREVAVKLLPTALRDSQEALARFRQEAKALAALNHPNIVTIYSIEEEQDDLFLTMEFVEGNTLDTYVRPGGMKTDEFEKVAVPLIHALSAAHASGVIHRDLKPSNIVVSHSGIVKVLDFGVARIMGEQSLTNSAMAVGTAAYMSPEQLSGEDVDGRSDLFSLGVIFYELLSGVRPFQGEHPAAIMYSICHEEAPRLTTHPDALVSMVHRCLEKSLALRFAYAEEIIHALEESKLAHVTSPQTAQGEAAEARAAYDRNDWDAAYRAFQSVGRQRELSPEELETFATCAMWLSKFDEGIKARTKAYAAYSISGRKPAAARVAIELTVEYIRKGLGTVSQGWLKRAEHLLENQPDCIEHGYLLRRHSMMAFGQGDLDGALASNQKSAAIAVQFHDADLQAMALHHHGHILVLRGDVEEGMALIDEAMTAAVSGELTPWTLGSLYCRTMSVCEEIADFQRAREWSEVTWHWCAPYGTSPFPGICRVHSAETMRHLGMWAEAKQAARAAKDDFEKNGNLDRAGDAFNEIGQLARLTGDYGEAEAAFRRANELGCDPVPGLPLLRLAQGQGEVAVQTMERALKECPDFRLNRAKLLAPLIFIALETQKLSLAESAARELSEIAKDFDCPAYKAHALMGEGALSLVRGRHESAAPPLREAWSIFNKMGFSYDAARARVFLAGAYLEAGNVGDAKLQIDAACKTFGELGAKPDLDAASTLLTRLK